MIQFKWDEMSALKDPGIFAGWIGAILLLGGLLWLGTQGIRMEMTARSVNKVLQEAGDQRRIGAPRPFRSLPDQGSRYALLNQPGGAVVFSVMTGGGALPFVAMISPEGIVEELIPLARNRDMTLEQVSPGFLQSYIRRIEAGEALITSREGKK
ncbi:MAG: hypothetical protein LBU28_05510 [Spirochaetaceae bacterium]|jgi:hypothetical protein|nr:hypothetical protein [Spirochaetaceae bacterium]